MAMTPVELKLHPEMLRAAAALARDRDITVGQLVRDLLAREISKARQARPPSRADERLVAPLRARLAPILAKAETWDEMQRALAAHDFALRAAGGGLALHTLRGNRRVCKASELGFSYLKLMRRLNAPFPGHPHHWLSPSNPPARH
ncbi:hypothetical protein [Thalassovita mangrovi]|uniref:Uncharacterized protein n=1 Tax=Thalassovita mangrovi TaxID=2692236 RepID=A0A6L8LQY9_9RHOB|nr:hypothetical protein [Thalassovita mangrovi]MYM55589.1 hypothetical protein [Thalassovita mangrovi]